MRDQEGLDTAADAADAAARDAQTAGRAASDAKVLAQLAAQAAAQVASRTKDATAASVASLASMTAKVAAGAAAAVASEAVARAFEAAVSAVETLEAVAARLPADADKESARLEAASVADAVADEVLVQAQATADAAVTVATAVTAAAESAAIAAATAAAIVEREARASAVAGGAVANATVATAAAVDGAAESAGRVAELTARLRLVAALRDSEQRFNVTFQHSSLGMALISLDPAQPGRVLRVNPALCELTGRAERDLLAVGWPDLVEREDRQEQAELLAILVGGAVSAPESVARWRHADGLSRWVRVRVHVLRDGTTGPAYAVGQVEDITARRRAETALREREEAFRLAFDHAVTGMMFLSLDGTLNAANEALRLFLGRAERDVVGQHLATLACRDEQPGLRAGVHKVAAGDLSSYHAEHRFERADGSDSWGVVSGERVDDAEGRPSYLVFQIKDVTPRKQAEFQLARLAFRDGLTGLANRALLRDRLEQARARAVRNHSHFSVLSIDLDNFKDLNDSLGHAGGDEILIEFASRLTGCLRATDTACRSGGDEFHVVCDDVQEPAEAGALLERIEAFLCVPFAVADTQVRVTASAGVVTDDGTALPEELLRDADTAMYRAKKNGKNRYEVHSPDMRVAVLRRATLAGALETAVADGQLRLHYQPMFAMTTGAVVGVEALLRWQHPTRGLLAPGHFLDVAESLRLMTPIGDWVIATAVAQAASWHSQAGSQSPDMWFNVSSQQLGKGRIVALVGRALAETGLPAAKLGVEITERHLIGEADDVRADLLGLSDLGLRLAVDDFGTGFGSFDYLRRFPFNEIKIDVSFVAGLGSDRTDTAVTSSIIALGRSLDLVVVAEGVETQDQYDRLKDLRCGVAQGYLLCRPAPPEAIGPLLGSRVPVQTPDALQAVARHPTACSPKEA